MAGGRVCAQEEASGKPGIGVLGGPVVLQFPNTPLALTSPRGLQEHCLPTAHQRDLRASHQAPPLKSPPNPTTTPWDKVSNHQPLGKPAPYQATMKVNLEEPPGATD